MTLRETVARAIRTRTWDEENPNGPAGLSNLLVRRALVEYGEQLADAALEAIRAAGPTEAQIEAGALAVLTLHCAGNPMWEADEAFERSDVANQIARACLSAALAAKET